MFSAASLRALLERCRLQVIHREGLGVVLSARGRSEAGATRFRLIENIVCHWRLRFIAERLSLKDEQMVIAIKNS
jgi:hypothetical protein